MSAGAGRSRYRAVVFDLFGTLLDFDPERLPAMDVDGRRVRSTVPRYEALVARYAPGVAAGEFSTVLREVTEAVHRAHRTTLVETPSRARFRLVLERVGCAADRLEEAAAVLSRAHHAAIAAATIFPESRRAVLAAAAARGPVALVSNFDDTASGFAILARHGILPSLAAVVVSEAVGFRKPHPVPLATALATLGLSADEVLMVGDSYDADVGVASALGADAAWIDPARAGPPAGKPPPRYVLERLEDLEPILRER
jgi:FMN phosphatase YigB (HAD superfamily)